MLPCGCGALTAQVENCWHWVWDVAFQDQECCIRSSHASENLALSRHIALNLLRQDKTAKVGVKAKRLKAAWDYTYLLKLLAPVRCTCPKRTKLLMVS